MNFRFFSSIVATGVLYLSGMAGKSSVAQEATSPRGEAPAASATAPPVVKITGQYADQITVALLTLLSDSYYQTGEFDFS